MPQQEHFDKMSSSGHAIKKFRRTTILQLNIEDHTATTMIVLQHLAEELEALIILAQHQFTWDGFTKTCLGKGQLPHWCWKIRVIHKRGLAPTSFCECEVLDQTAVHVILEYPLYLAPRGYHGLLDFHDDSSNKVLKFKYKTTI